MEISYPPPAAAPVSTSVFTRRRHIFERATKDECADLSARLEQSDDQLAQIFMASDWIDHANSLWPTLQAIVTDVVGAERAAVLLAPSPYPEM